MGCILFFLKYSSSLSLNMCLTRSFRVTFWEWAWQTEWGSPEWIQPVNSILRRYLLFQTAKIPNMWNTLGDAVWLTESFHKTQKNPFNSFSCFNVNSKPIYFPFILPTYWWKCFIFFLPNSDLSVQLRWKNTLWKETPCKISESKKW